MAARLQEKYDSEVRGKLSEAFDIKNAPLSLYIYARCSDERLDELSSLSQGMFKGEVEPRALLKAVPDQLRATIAHGLSEMILSRAPQFKALV